MIENSPTQSFDRMRSMLQRAAEVRDSEQQQIFDSLDEIHGRLAALDALGAIRKRLTDVPDRTEVGVLAQRLDEAVAKLDAQDAAVGSLTRAVEHLVDRVGERLATPLAQLDGRLDGVAGRFEGVAGRMDGLEDRLAGLHKRLDDLDTRLDRHDVRLEDTRRELVGELTGSRGDETTARSRTAEQVSGLAGRIETLTGRLDAVGGRVDAVESTLGDRVAALSAAVEDGLDKLDGSLVNRPDHEALVALVRAANEESERRNADHLDEAMATFAEIILGPGGGSAVPMPAPRPAARRSARRSPTREGPDDRLNGNGTYPAEEEPAER